MNVKTGGGCGKSVRSPLIKKALYGLGFVVSPLGDGEWQGSQGLFILDMHLGHRITGMFPHTRPCETTATRARKMKSLDQKSITLLLQRPTSALY